MAYIKLLLYMSLIWKQIRILFAYHLRVMDNILSLTACLQISTDGFCASTAGACALTVTAAAVVFDTIRILLSVN